MKKTSYKLLPLFFFALIGMLLTACQSGNLTPQAPSPVATEVIVEQSTATIEPEVDKKEIVVFVAGSLIIPFTELEKAFEAKYPHIDMRGEYHGSIQVMRHVTDLHEPIDLVVTADASLIPLLMYATDNPSTGNPYANWFINFAGNSLTLAYTENSIYADELTAENWPEILSRPDVKFGIPDPRFDAAGYRAMMAFALYENLHQKNGAFKTMFKDQFTYPVSIFREDGIATIRIPEILETKTDDHVMIRSASVFLIALLESGDVDYAFEYDSVVKQHGLKYLELPPLENMGDEDLREEYEKVLVKLDFKRFLAIEPIFTAEPIRYAITIPDSSPNPEEAELFIQFLLSEEGRAVMESNYHPMFNTCLADGFESMPESLQEICVADE